MEGKESSVGTEPNGLLDSEKLLLDVFNSIQDGIYVLDTDLTIRRANGVMNKWYAPNRPLEGKKCFRCYHNRNEPCQPCPALRCLESGNMEREVVSGPEGSEAQWLELFAYPIKDDKTGRIIGVVEFVRDITQRKRTEEANQRLTRNLMETSNMLEAILNTIPDVIGVQDLEHRIIRYNRAGYAFLGLTPEQVHGKKCYELIGRSHPCSVCATVEVYQTLQNAQVEKYVEEMDKWLDVRAYPVFDENGRFVQVIEHLRDITQEKRSEIELKESQERFLTVLDSIDAHIYVADLETYEILFMNKKMIDDFGADYVGRICHDVFRNEASPCGHCTNDRLLDEKGESTGVIVWEDVNPVTGKCYLNFDRAIKWVNGRTVRIQIATDITQIKHLQEEHERMQQQFEQSQKMEAIGTLAGGIAHDFNNLLMGIQGRASLMLSGINASHEHFDHLKGIETYVKSATDLTRQLLGFARGGKYEIKPVNLNEVVDESAKMFWRTRKEIHIHKKYADALWTAEVDRGQIQQVLMNLFVNAWQAMPVGGELFLQTENVLLADNDVKGRELPAGRYVNITVTDTGIGMDPKTLSRIFDPFFTTKGVGRGTGLGLASVYGIVQNHNGMINAGSEQGKGSTFTIYLPASEKEILQETAEDENFLPGTGTILLVDDEEMIVVVGRQILERLGYRVLTAGSGREAIRLYSGQPEKIDLVILDMIMPDLGGGETFDRLKAVDADVPVLLSSGYSVDGQAEEILRRGCRGFIQKPFSMGTLSEKVHAILGRTGDYPEDHSA